MKKLNILIVLFVAVCISSCYKNNLLDPEKLPASPVAGEWWVSVLVGSDDIGGTRFKIYTYNDDVNKDSIWIDDGENIFGFKAKAKADFAGKTFAGTNSGNEYYPADSTLAPSVTFANGKVLPKAAHSKTGVVCDSIYMEVQLAGDPTTYILKGCARTNWPDDDY
ncbi:lipid-binding protein [Deminuibacter soli]|uniref:Lipid-binding hydrolase n=1 Tax=Deminuibacter soli TaxID=2291815 RepID=A0A3E1NDN7_9BACT|nr:lipid-binding protein [Deminuibacter soli]RFM25987.1 hypothetical protein DXN05_21890 [Deminuibacter soli]